MAFLDLLKPRARPAILPAVAATAGAVPAAIATPAPPGDVDPGDTHRPPPMRAIADRLELRIAADFAMFSRASVAASRHREDRRHRRLAAHLAAEARPLHALGSFTVALELSSATANAWLLPDDVDPASLPGGWADALYSNRLAPGRDLERDLAGIWHMLRPGGLLVADLPGARDLCDDAAGFELVETRDPGLLQGRSWHRAILVRRLES